MCWSILHKIIVNTVRSKWSSCPQCSFWKQISWYDIAWPYLLKMLLLLLLAINHKSHYYLFRTLLFHYQWGPVTFNWSYLICNVFRFYLSITTLNLFTIKIYRQIRLYYLLVLGPSSNDWISLFIDISNSSMSWNL